jgi:hypothetical protein
MRVAAIGVFLSASLVMIAWAVTAQSVGLAQRHSPPTAGAAGLFSHVTQVADNRQQVTVVDPDTRTIAVYHIDSSKGEITLKCVRNIHWDLQMVEFNTQAPSPGDIRTLLER